MNGCNTLLTLTTVTPAEQRIVLHHISWQFYEQFQAAIAGQSSPRLTYYQGTLEVMSPLEEHESARSLIGRFIEILIAELRLNLKTMGSTRLKRPELAAGGEPDECYYIQNEPLVRGRMVDLKYDPPPDLVIEVDITHTDIDKLRLYTDLGIPEFWRYNGQVWRIYRLQNGEYKEVGASPTFSWVNKSALYSFLEECRTFGEVQAELSFQAWVREKVQELQVEE